MVSIDLRTLVFSFVITNIIVTLIIVMLWYQNRKRFSGTSLWVIDFLFQTTALILISLRGTIPDWISMVVSNALVISGTIIGLIALERFVGVKRNNLHNYSLLVLFIFLSIWFSHVKPDLAIRNLNLAAAMLISTLQCSWLIFFKVKGELRKIAAGVGVVFVVYSLINVLRIADFFISDHSATDYFTSGKFEMFVLISYQMLFILLTYNLALMFNKRLISEVKLQEEKFSKAFHSSPYAIILTRLDDGKIFQVNKGFEDISGYNSSEVIGVTTNELNIWYKEEERAVFVEELSRLGRVVEKELRFRKKSGEPLICLMSSEIISINNERCVLSSINDITKRKNAEESLRETGEYLENLINYANAPIIVWDTNLKITRFNSAFENMTGLKAEEVINKKIDILFPAESIEESMVNIRNTTMGARWEIVEIPVLKIDGTTRTVLWNSATIYDKDRITPVAAIAQGQDITDRKRAEKQLIDKIQELEKFNKVMVGRELKMVELKLEINELCGRLNLPARYKVAEGSENEKVIR
jgi:PAS domain S-box-containing protein